MNIERGYIHLKSALTEDITRISIIYVNFYSLFIFYILPGNVLMCVEIWGYNMGHK